MNENNTSENSIAPKKERKTLTAGTLSLSRSSGLEITNKSLISAKNSKGTKSSVAVEVKRNVNIPDWNINILNDEINVSKEFLKSLNSGFLNDMFELEPALSEINLRKINMNQYLILEEYAKSQILALK